MGFGVRLPGFNQLLKHYVILRYFSFPFLTGKTGIIYTGNKWSICVKHLGECGAHRTAYYIFVIMTVLSLCNLDFAGRSGTSVRDFSCKQNDLTSFKQKRGLVKAIRKLTEGLEGLKVMSLERTHKSCPRAALERHNCCTTGQRHLSNTGRPQRSLQHPCLWLLQKPHPLGSPSPKWISWHQPPKEFQSLWCMKLDYCLDPGCKGNWEDTFLAFSLGGHGPKRWRILQIR